MYANPNPALAIPGLQLEALEMGQMGVPSVEREAGSE